MVHFDKLRPSWPAGSPQSGQMRRMKRKGRCWRNCRYILVQGEARRHGNIGATGRRRPASQALPHSPPISRLKRHRVLIAVAFLLLAGRFAAAIHPGLGQVQRQRRVPKLGLAMNSELEGIPTARVDEILRVVRIGQ